MLDSDVSLPEGESELTMEIGDVHSLAIVNH